MSDEAKKVVAMTPKRFIRAKLSGKTTAEGFLSAHREFLRSHQFLSPILDAYEAKEILPTPTLDACKAALFDHVIACEVKTAQASVQKSKDRAILAEKKGIPLSVLESTKPYIISVFVKNDKGEMELGIYEKVVGYKIKVGDKILQVETQEEAEGHKIVETLKEDRPMVWTADNYSAAERMADRRLFKYEHSIYAEIENTQGIKIKTRIPRADSIARLLRASKRPFMRERGKSTSTLKFQGKAKQDTAHFSRG